MLNLLIFCLSICNRHIFHANGDQKKAGVAILISDKIDFQIKAVKRDKSTQLSVLKVFSVAQTPTKIHRIELRREGERRKWRCSVVENRESKVEESNQHTPE